MENSSTIWNNIANWLTGLGFPAVSPYAAMSILTAAFLVLLVILWLVFRKTRLWYWKTDIQIDTLKSIDSRLHNVEERLSTKSIMMVDNAEIELLEQDAANPLQETAEEETEQENVGMTAVGKSGRIYTEAELELQIRE